MKDESKISLSFQTVTPFCINSRRFHQWWSMSTDLTQEGSDYEPNTPQDS